ncbi:DNA-binding response regulator [Methylophaga sp. 41_12_T18]|nr:DNA-binding response regulator [Methylophaga sp. 41_12_T18]
MASLASKAHILIIEDDQILNDQIAEQLINKGYSIEQCFCGDQGLTTAVSKFFDLILLDVLLPVRDGFSVLNNLRKTRDTPVVMLTACGAEEDRIKGFSKGADDYLPKPFNFTELGLRIDALLRRTKQLSDAPIGSNEITNGLLTLNKNTQQIIYNEQPLSMTPIQFKLLWVLVSHQHETLSKPYLYQLVLEREFSAYDRSLDMHLSRVRRKLISAGMPADRLQTVHGLGYLFT